MFEVREVVIGTTDMSENMKQRGRETPSEERRSQVVLSVEAVIGVSPLAPAIGAIIHTRHAPSATHALPLPASRFAGQPC